MSKLDNQIERIVEKYECQEAAKFKNKIRIVRKDGFVVFLDRIKPGQEFEGELTALNKLRLIGKPLEIMAAVGFVRGMQIAENYAQGYHKKDVNKLRHIMANVFASALENKQVKKI